MELTEKDKQLIALTEAFERAVIDFKKPLSEEEKIALGIKLEAGAREFDKTGYGLIVNEDGSLSIIREC